MVLIPPRSDFSIFLLGPIFYAVPLFLLSSPRRKDTFYLPGFSITLFPICRHSASILFLREKTPEKKVTFRNLYSQGLLFHTLRMELGLYFLLSKIFSLSKAEPKESIGHKAQIGPDLRISENCLIQNIGESNIARRKASTNY
jgi:hypothetical protein